MNRLACGPAARVLITCAAISAMATAQAQQRSVDELARIIIEAPVVKDVQLGPDGKWLIYSVSRASVAENRTAHAQWLQRMPQGASAMSPPVQLPAAIRSPRWRPGTRTFGYLRQPTEEQKSNFALYDADSGASRVVTLQGPVPVGRDFKWSPRGNFVAFSGELTLPAKASGLQTDRGVLYSAWNRFADRPERVNRVFVLDIASGKVEQITPDDLRVTDFAWSPDEARLALVVDRQVQSYGTQTDIMLIDRQGGAPRELVTQTGKDNEPLWSPDGRWIAFSSQAGKPDYFHGWPAVISAAGGSITTFPGAGKATPFRWSADSRRVIYGMRSEFTQAYAQFDIRTRKVRSVPAWASDFAIPNDSNLSIAKDANIAVFIRSAVSVPTEIYMGRIDAAGFPVGAPRKLSNFSADFPLAGSVRSQIVSWRSRDGMTIHGLLNTPAAAWTNEAITKPLPALVTVTGGPSMVSRKFAGDTWGGLELAAAVRGYAVLVPNSRGRPGYGDAVHFGIRDAKSYIGVPYTDVIGGVEHLIQGGIADADRLAIGGHSYGGTLAAYAITQTDRFKSALVYEPGSADLTAYAYPTERGTWSELLSRDLVGVHDARDPAQIARLIEESPGLHARRIKTPTLLSFRPGNKESAKFYSALRYLNVPFAMFVYDDDHVFTHPGAASDHMTRSLEWTDRWVRGIDWPDAGRAAEYESWQHDR